MSDNPKITQNGNLAINLNKLTTKRSSIEFIDSEIEWYKINKIDLTVALIGDLFS